MLVRKTAAAVLLLLLAFSTAQAGEKAKIPRPTDKLDPAPPPPAVEPSSMNLPVTVSVEALAGAVAKGFPDQKGEEKTWLDGAALVSRPAFEYKYLLWRRGASSREGRSATAATRSLCGRLS